MIRRVAIFWLSLVLVLFAVGQALPATEAALFQKANSARQQLEADTKAQQLRHSWTRVMDEYKRLLRQYPSGAVAPKALLAMGDLNRGLFLISRGAPDLDQAIDYYKTLTQKFPTRPESAQAQLRIGELYYHHKDDSDRAYIELLKVELNHPSQKKQIDEARKLMARISGEAGVKLDPAETKTLTAAKVNPSPPTAPEPESPKGAVVQSLRHWHNPTYSRVAVDLTDPVRHKDHLLRPDPSQNKPMRLYIDLNPARISPTAQGELTIGDGLLKTARVAQYNADTVRVVLDIQNIKNYRIFNLQDPFRLVVDVMGSRAVSPKDQALQTKVAPKLTQTQTRTARAEPTSESRPKAPLTDLRPTAQKRKKVPRGVATGTFDKASLARQLGLGVSKIVIDPGHGGKDNGATGVTGLREKDLVLKFSQMLAAKIRDRLGLEVVLTRSKDIFIPLEERTAIANTVGADLFISIHANAHKSAKVHGIETYFLNLATDEESMRVAARENATSRKNMSDLQIILSDLMLNSKITESGRLGQKVHRSLVGTARKKYTGVHDLKVKQAPFYVLIGANMPSILVELGFLSNPSEEKRLKNSHYLNLLTDGIVEGIRSYTSSMKKPVKS